MQPAVFSKHLLTTLAGFTLSLSLGFAARVPTPVSSDIFLAFRASANQGADKSYLVNLGQITQFTNVAPGASITLTTIGDLGADLTANYGTSVTWHTRPDLYWAVFGTATNNNPTVYASKERTVVGTQSDPWPALSNGARTATKTEILGPLTAEKGYADLDATPNSLVAAFQTNISETSSYNFQITSGATDFGTQSQWSNIEGYFGGSVSATVLDFYRLRTASPTVSYLGKFTISTAGVVTFTAAGSSAPVDTDGDGQTDAQEVAAGTNPNSAADFFKVQTVQTTGTVNNIYFNTIPSRSYVIEYSENLNGTWIPVGSPYVTTTTGGAVIIADSDPVRAARPKGFYRVKVTQ